MNNEETNELYKWMLSVPAFHYDDIVLRAGNSKKATCILHDMKNEGLIMSVRRGMFVALDNGSPVGNYFQIASHINNNCCISHHTAFEFYGAYNQVFYAVYVSSPVKFNHFDFNGMTFLCKKNTLNIGIQKIDSVYVTDPERTVIESIKDSDKIAGLEEVVQCISLMDKLDENKLIAYLETFNNCSLWQKTGYIFSSLLKIPFSEEFYKKCKINGGNKVRYLYTGNGFFTFNLDKNWNLYVPNNINTLLGNGGDEIV